MFKSIKYIRFLKCENNLYYDLYKIIDDDFEEEHIGEVPMEAVNTTRGASARAVINCYSLKKLNVAKNLILFMQYYQEQYNYYSIAEQIYWYKKYTPEFNTYLPEIEKYLNLL